MYTSSATRSRGVHRKPFSSNRRLVVAATRVGRRKTPIYGLLDVDVTEARRRLAACDRSGSMTAFVVASVARAAAAHPEVHAYRDWRGHLVTHDHVDVSTMVEVPTTHGLFAVPHSLHDADVRDVDDLTAELRRVKADPPSSASARWADHPAAWAMRIPGSARRLFEVMSRSVAVHQRIGTVGVTSVGMFADGSGYGLTPLTLMSLEVVVGGIARLPRLVDGQVEARDILNLTVVVDHDVVDGAPATRFAADLRRALETAGPLS
ncbi:2-oxo acid dehydrogenase subunit E2 [Nocardioides panacisoli]|uniref:2-oxoacid dehydrogenase acyltransferase catalytic domain-containing protein n=1 Tax=Nocardioides panacisoli TaxID=627624 RepID=A0ABP7IP92_9ACTN